MAFIDLQPTYFEYKCMNLFKKMFIVISLAYLLISIRRMNNNYSPDSCEFPTEIVHFQVPVVLISRHTWNV